MPGWIKLHRKIRDHYFWKQRRKFSWFEAFLDLLLSANHLEGKVLMEGNLIPVARGQFVTSQMELSRRWRWNRKTVKHFLSILQNDEILTYESSRRADMGYTTITLCNYSKYQDTENEGADKQADKQADIAGTTEGQENGHKQEDKNVKKGERVKKKLSRSKNSDPRIRQFFDWWAEEYRQRFSDGYKINGEKEGPLLKSLLGTFDLPRLQNLGRRFLDSEDSWVRENGGFTIGIFASQINKLVSTSRAAQRQTQPKEKHDADLKY